MSLSLTFKSLNNGRVVSVVQSRRKLSFLKRIEPKLGKKGQFYLRVNYSPSLHNDGFYPDRKSLLFAYKCFTEADLERTLGMRS